MRKISKTPWCRYRKLFGITFLQLQAMSRPAFARAYGERFLHMTSSKFRRETNRMVRAYERGKDKQKLLKGEI